MIHKLCIFVFVMLFIFSADCVNARISEELKIEYMIASLSETPEGTKFIRNGTAYSSGEAAEHLRTKYKYGKKYAATAALFIENIASKSSFTGTDYSIKFVDGKIVTAREFFAEKLKKIEEK